MVNIELDTNPQGLVDIDMLASAASNMKTYFKDLRMLEIQFHLIKGVHVDRERVNGIVCSLVKLEALLPWQGRLAVKGFEDHQECQIAWVKKSRKFWE
jgi:hypothetical protein